MTVHNRGVKHALRADADALTKTSLSKVALSAATSCPS
jgi:hypothetical protein